MPEKMHWRRLAGKAPAEFFEDVVNRNQRSVKTLHVFFVVRSVFGVFSKRSRRRCFVGHSPDLRLDAEFGKIGKNALVKIRNAQSVVQIEILAATLAAMDL